MNQIVMLVSTFMSKYPIILFKLPGQGTALNVISILSTWVATIILSYTLMGQSLSIVNKPGEKNITQSMLMLMFTPMSQIAVALFHNCYQDTTTDITLKKLSFLLALACCYGVLPFSLTLFSVSEQQPYEPLKPALMDASYLCAAVTSNLISYLGSCLYPQEKEEQACANPQGGADAKNPKTTTRLLL